MCCIMRRRLLLDELYKDGEIILDLLYQERGKEIITGCVVIRRERLLLDLLYQGEGEGDYYWMSCIRRRRLLLDELYKEEEIIT